MIDRILELCERYKTNLRQLEIKLGFANGSLKKSNQETIQASRVKKLADYFGVSMEYILSGETYNEPIISDFEYKIIVSFRNSPMQDAVLRLLGMEDETAKEKEAGLNA